MPDPPLDLVIENVRVVRPRRPQLERLHLGVQDGRFARIAPDIPAADARAVYDARARFGFPGWSTPTRTSASTVRSRRTR